MGNNIEETGKKTAGEGAAPKKRAVVIRPQNSSKAKSGRPASERSQEGTRAGVEKKPFNGERRQDGNRSGSGERRQDGNRPNNGERRQDGNRSNNGERRQDGNRPNNGERRSFGGNGERRQDGNRSNNGERRSFGGNGERRQDGNRPNNGERRQDGNRSNNGERRQDGNRSNNGERRSFGGNGERRQDGDRRGQGGRQDGRGAGGRGQGSGMIHQDSYMKPSQANNKQNKKQQDNRSKDKYNKKDREENLKKMEKSNLKKLSKQAAKQEEEIKTLTLPEKITIKELAEMMKMQPSAIVKKLFMAGQMVTINQEVDYDTAESIALDFDYLCEREVKVDVIEELLKDVEDPEDTLVERAPVVCVMGHVDHGKTSLLDAIRKTNVIAKEAGGITQHIGAYMVECNGHPITFLDTPGHEAFTAMRLRGAKSTDIAVLVVAADDGVMPQTIEAISHAKAAGVEIIVAVNKIDKPSANIERVKQELTEHGLIAEDWGGSTIFVPVSAHTGEGIDELLEMILLASEVKELKANPNRKARGIVIEALLDKGRGPVANILVQKGTLHVGDVIAVGSCYGKVRAMMDENDRRVKEAGPSKPVSVLGLNDVPGAGEIFIVPDSEKEARSFAETFIAANKEKLIDETRGKMSLDDLFSQIQAGKLKELELIIKADVQGSVEAVKQSLLKLSNDEVIVKVIHGGVGAINESDVNLASASNAIIIGFNVRPDATARAIAEREKVDVRLYRVIYQAIADVEAAMKGMLDPIFEEQVIGHAVVRQTFKASGVGMIAGSYITDGKFIRGCKCRLTRGTEQLFDGPMASLKRFKDDVKEVAAGYECGVVLEGFSDIREEDTLEAYQMVEVPR
ncbi:MAG: translation initiation factor IF-2 [Lachnospiraceae bacterium]